MYFLAALTRADTSIFHSVYAFSVVRSEEILLHSVVCDKDLERKTLAWDAITSVVDNESNVVKLE